MNVQVSPIKSQKFFQSFAIRSFSSEQARRKRDISGKNVNSSTLHGAMDVEQ